MQYICHSQYPPITSARTENSPKGKPHSYVTVQVYTPCWLTHFLFSVSTRI